MFRVFSPCIRAYASHSINRLVRIGAVCCGASGGRLRRVRYSALIQSPEGSARPPGGRATAGRGALWSQGLLTVFLQVAAAKRPPEGSEADTKTVQWTVFPRDAPEHACAGRERVRCPATQERLDSGPTQNTLLRPAQIREHPMDRRFVMDGLYGLSVKVNDMFIPGKLVEDYFSTYCTSLGVWTGMDDFPLYVPGSATLLRYNKRCYMICTRHQLKQTDDWASVCMLLPNGQCQTKCITSGGARWFDKIGDGEHQDIVAFDFTEPARDLPELSPLFFPFQGEHPSIPASQIIAFITYGYPTSQADFDFEKGSIKQVRGRVLSHFSPPGSDDALHIIEPNTPVKFDPDGRAGDQRSA